MFCRFQCRLSRIFLYMMWVILRINFSFIRHRQQPPATGRGGRPGAPPPDPRQGASMPLVTYLAPALIPAFPPGLLPSSRLRSRLLGLPVKIFPALPKSLREKASAQANSPAPFLCNPGRSFSHVPFQVLRSIFPLIFLITALGYCCFFDAVS